MPENTHSTYTNPLCTRYASKEMQYLFSDDNKFSTWRKLWVALARSEQELGLDITDAQIAEMEAHIYDIDYACAEKKEREVRHDVMAHVHTYGEACPAAKPIIHLGATSCYVGDNTDLIIIHDALSLIKTKLVNLISTLCGFAEKYKDLPTLGFTHFQPAQLTTVGKRAALWIHDLTMDYAQLDSLCGDRKLLGCKGTTGTQASFLELFGGDAEKVLRLDALIAEKMGYNETFAVSGQTYSRKFDSRVLETLSAIAQTAHKFSNDLRLLQHLKEIEEPFEKSQIGSSAMAYKRNPMRSERIAALSRYVITNSQNAAMTAAEQWFERTLDDSANRRISISQGFLAADAILTLMQNVSGGLVVYPKVIESRIRQELPFMITENVLMQAVLKGGDRQDLHERIRVHSMEAGRKVKELGEKNDLLQRIADDRSFNMTMAELESCLDPAAYTGIAALQTERFLTEVREKILSPNKNLFGGAAEITV